MPSTLDFLNPRFQGNSSTLALRQQMLVILLLSIVFSPFHLSAQPQSAVDTNEVQLSDINPYKNIASKCAFWASPRLVSSDELPRISYIDSLPAYLQYGIADSVVDQHIYLRFRAYNNSDSVRRMYFFPGIHYKQIQLYKGELNRVISLPDTGRPKFADSSGYKFILFEPGEHATVYARINPVRTHTNFFRAYLVSAPDVQIWRAYFKGIENDSKIFGFIIAGMLMMMIFYATINFLQSSQLEFIYYSLYASFLGLLFFLYALHNRSSTGFNYFLESYFDLALQLTAHFFYCLFLQRFLETSANLPRLHKLLRFSQVLIVAGLLIYTYAYFSGMPFGTLNQIENISKYFLLGLGIVIVITGLIKKNKLLNYIMLGNLFLMLMSVFSLLFSVFDWQPFPAGSLFNRSLILYEIGIVIELIFFLTGLSFKNRNELIVRTAEREKLKMENERKELDKQIAILEAQKEERSRISVDMHDELGSGMTAIRLMSELALNKMKDARIPELEKISSSANDLLVKMNAIIWSMSQANDSLANLLTYIRYYSLEYFENTSIQCMVNLPEEIPVKEMSGEKRRNTFLTVKETLNNTLKHSKASAVQINVSLNGALEICIQDNGTGIEMAKVGPFGNGLRNMKKRIESIGGLYQISRNEGTLTVLQIPL